MPTGTQARERGLLRQHPGPADTSFVCAPPSRVEDPGANFFGVTVSNGLDITIGSF